MKLEEKRKLLTGDLMSRANYWIDLKVDYKGKAYTLFGYGAGRVSLLANPFMSNTEGVAPLIEEIKPYLRSLSSMTEEEKKCLQELSSGLAFRADLLNNVILDIWYRTDAIDWLIAHHFDIRGLIEKGLALEAPEGMYDF